MLWMIKVNFGLCYFEAGAMLAKPAFQNIKDAYYSEYWLHCSGKQIVVD